MASQSRPAPPSANSAVWRAAELSIWAGSADFRFAAFWMADSTLAAIFCRIAERPSTHQFARRAIRIHLPQLRGEQNAIVSNGGSQVRFDDAIDAHKLLDDFLAERLGADVTLVMHSGGQHARRC